MHFAEAEQKYHELEAKLVHGELSEDDFLTQAAELRVLDQYGQRWMLSGETGRWYAHDGQRWVLADPPPEQEPEAPAPIQQDLAAAVATPAVKPPSASKASPPAAARRAKGTQDQDLGEDLRSGVEAAGSLDGRRGAVVDDTSPLQSVGPRRSRVLAPRLLVLGAAAVLLVVCLIGGAAAAWVLLLRGYGEATSTPTMVAEAPVVATFTPRPATPTYTPTFTPTPSRTPTPTKTPIASDTPLPTNTSLPVPTLPVVTPTEPLPSPSPSPMPSATGPSASKTYTVKKGDTLWDIATRFGISVAALAKANGISATAPIHAGQVLTIPAPGTTPAAPTPTATPTRSPTATTSAIAGRTPTPTWTPIVLVTPTGSPTPTKVSSTPTATKPAGTPKPTSIPTAKPVALSGKIAFTVWNPYIGMGVYELYISHIDGSGRNMLGTGFRQPQLRSDGALLVVNGEGASNLEHLVTMDTNGNSKIEVSANTEDSYPTWSPDGRVVVYSSSSWGDGRTLLGLVSDMTIRKQDWIRVGSVEIQGEYTYWMSDGAVIYHGCDFLGDLGACGLFWVGAGGGSYRRVTTHSSDTAPDGFKERIAFMSSRDGNWEVYTVNEDGSGLKRVTNNAAQDGLPTWSPDGQSIAFVSNRSSAWAIWVMNADGSNQRKLFDLGGGYGSGASAWTTERISWSP
jgi:LysM repeat protein